MRRTTNPSGCRRAVLRSVGLSSGDSVRLIRKDHAPGTVLPWHRHDRASLTVVLAGSILETFRGGSLALRRGDVLYMPEGTDHDDRYGVDVTTSFILELPPRAHRMLAGRPLPGSPRPIQGDGVWDSLLRMAREASADDPCAEMILQGEIAEILPSISVDPPPAARAPRWLIVARERLREEYLSPPSLRDLAAESGVHPDHLTRSFRSRFGESAGEFVRRLRLGWASRRLAEGQLPIAAIASEAGFTDQSHFTRAFHRRFGVPPGRYRRLQHGGKAGSLTPEEVGSVQDAAVTAR